MNRSMPTITAVLAAAAIGALALGASPATSGNATGSKSTSASSTAGSKPASASSTAGSKPATKTTDPAAKATPASGHDHHDMSGMDMSKMDMSKAKGPAEKGKFTTITGEIMDPACFLEAGSKSIGPGHFQCATDCARSGQTLAIYDRAADRIYFIAGELPGKNPNDPVMRYIHQKVDVSGTVYHRADAWGIVITRVVPHDGAAAPASAPTGK